MSRKKHEVHLDHLMKADVGEIARRLAQALGDVMYRHNPETQTAPVIGVAVQIVKAREEAPNEYALFLSSDTLLDPNLSADEAVEVLQGMQKTLAKMVVRFHEANILPVPSTEQEATPKKPGRRLRVIH